MKKFVFIIIAAFFVACATENADMEAKSMSLDKENGSYKISHIIVNGKTLKAPSEATLSFSGERIYGNTGCNNYFSSAKWIDKKTLKLGYAGSTRMLCHEQEINNFEHIYLKNIEGEFETSYKDGKFALESQNLSIFLNP